MKRFITILLLLSLFGCKLSNDLYDEWKPTLEIVEKSKMDGEFWNLHKSSTDSTWGSLWRTLYYAQTFTSKSFKNMDSTSIKIRLINDTLLISELIKNESIIDSLKLYGKIQDNYFSVNQVRQRFLTPIYWRNFNTKILVGTPNNDSLSVIHLNYNEGVILLFLGGNGGGISRGNYLRKN